MKLAIYLVFYYMRSPPSLCCRSTTAETEVFTKACSAIEARLEHKVKGHGYVLITQHVRGIYTSIDTRKLRILSCPDTKRKRSDTKHPDRVDRCFGLSEGVIELVA